MPARLLAITAPSGTGKTTLLCALIPLLRDRGLAVGTLKRSHHCVEPDRPGKDSHRLRLAGASQVLVASARRSALFRSHSSPQASHASALAAGLGPGLDLILVEGDHRAELPRLALYRPAAGTAPPALDDPHLIAVACDRPPPGHARCPLLDLNDPAGIAEFICNWLQHP